MKKSDLPSSYVDLVYSEARTPKTVYPSQLIEYLISRFSLRPSSTVLELGSGRGEFLKTFKDLGFKTVAVDREINAELKSIADLSYACDLAKQAIPLPNESVDFIFHKSVIEHIYEPYHLMEESLRVLRPGGLVIIMTPEWASNSAVFFEDFSHVHPYTVEAVRDLMIFYRLELVAAEKFKQLPPVWNSSIARILSACIGATITTSFGRKLTALTGFKFFRWSCELMVLAVGRKKTN